MWGQTRLPVCICAGRRREQTRTAGVGTALEVAIGWFLHALRLKIGKFSLTIGHGVPEGGDPSDKTQRPYRL